MPIYYKCSNHMLLIIYYAINKKERTDDKPVPSDYAMFRMPACCQCSHLVSRRTRHHQELFHH